MRRWRVTMMLAGIAGLTVVGSHVLTAQGQPRRSVNPVDDLARRVQQIVGVDALDCGRHLRTGAGRSGALESDAVQRSVTCVVAAAQMKKTAWTMAQLMGIDSWVAGGLMARADGSLAYFLYDSDPSGGSGATPVLSVQSCTLTPSVKPDGWGGSSISCR